MPGVTADRAGSDGPGLQARFFALVELNPERMPLSSDIRQDCLIRKWECIENARGDVAAAEICVGYHDDRRHAPRERGHDADCELAGLARGIRNDRRRMGVADPFSG
jgi:hypothetical protein